MGCFTKTIKENTRMEIHTMVYSNNVIPECSMSQIHIGEIGTDGHKLRAVSCSIGKKKIVFNKNEGIIKLLLCGVFPAIL